jgi:RNA polymerase sigma-70 factor (ECF subfamily)
MRDACNETMLLPGLDTEEHMSRALSALTNARLSEELDQLFREHYQMVYRTAYGVTGNREDAQDVLQTIFLRLLKQKSPADLKKSPKAYLYRAAVNLSLNTIRQKQHRVVMDVAEHLDQAPDSRVPTTAERIHKRLYEAVSEFDSETAEILILRYIHNYDVAEIAKMLGKSRTLIAVRLFRSRARLKKLRAPQVTEEKP